MQWLSQQVQRLEREVGVLLLKRSTHHVSLTVAGAVFLAEARQILAHVDRGGRHRPQRRRRVRRVAGRHHRRQLRLDAADPARGPGPPPRPGRPPGRSQRARAVPAARRRPPGRGHRPGRARPAPDRIMLLFRHDPLGVLVPPGHRSPSWTPSRSPLAGEPLLLAEDPGPGVQPVHGRDVPGRRLHPDRVRGHRGEHPRRPPTWSRRDAACAASPSSCISALPGTTWRPLTEPASYYPWSVLWRATDTSDHVHAIVSCAQTMSRRLGWLVSPGQTVH